MYFDIVHTMHLYLCFFSVFPLMCCNGLWLALLLNGAIETTRVIYNTNRRINRQINKALQKPNLLGEGNQFTMPGLDCKEIPKTQKRNSFSAIIIVINTYFLDEHVTEIVLQSDTMISTVALQQLLFLRMFRPGVNPCLCPLYLKIA